MCFGKIGTLSQGWSSLWWLSILEVGWPLCFLMRCGLMAGRKVMTVRDLSQGQWSQKGDIVNWSCLILFAIILALQATGVCLGLPVSFTRSILVASGSLLAHLMIAICSAVFVRRIHSIETILLTNWVLHDVEVLNSLLLVFP
jgi:hypothetical protein